MKKTKLLFIFILTLICLLSALCFSACNKSSKNGNIENLTLDKTSLTVMAGGDSAAVNVLSNGVPYTGPVIWRSENTLFISVAHGYVKGIKAGETEVTAIINANSVKKTLSCKVTVTPEITAQLDSIYVYAGSGDINVNIANGLMTAGASYTVTGATDADGNNLSDLVYKNGVNYFVKNSESNPLILPAYKVKYKITLNGYEKELERNLFIKNSDRYENIFLLDPIDGTQTMYGAAKNVNYTINNNRNDENPGEFVRYTEEGNSGKEQSGGLDSNRAEFLASLKYSNYDGFLREGIKGYDTVYRMYVKKNNSTSSPFPYFYFNLLNTSGNLWENLTQFPSNATISVWCKVWFKATGSTEFVNVNSRWLYPYKNQNSGATYIPEGAVRGSFDKNGGWTNYKVSISTIKAAMNDAQNFAFGIDVSNPLGGEYYFDLYSVELDGMNDLFAPCGEVDVSLSGSFTGMFDSYKFEIFRSENKQKIFSGDSSKTVLTLNPGDYYVEYTLKKGSRALPEKFLRRLQAGIVTDLTKLSQISRSSWGTANTVEMLTDAPVGIPTDSSLKKETYIKTTVKDGLGRDLPVFDISAIMEMLDEGKLSDKDYIGFWLYQEGESNTTYYPEFYLSKGRPHASSLTEGNTIYPYADKGSFGGMQLLSPAVYNEWYLLKVTVGEIREVLKLRPDLKCDTICFNLKNNAAKDAVSSYYYYSMEFFMTERTPDFSANDQIADDMENWG